jgi:hypothetical protein
VKVGGRGWDFNYSVGLAEVHRYKIELLFGRHIHNGLPFRHLVQHRPKEGLEDLEYSQLVGQAGVFMDV